MVSQAAQQSSIVSFTLDLPSYVLVTSSRIGIINEVPGYRSEGPAFELWSSWALSHLIPNYTAPELDFG